MTRKSKQLKELLPEVVPKVLLLPCLLNSFQSYPFGAGFFVWQRKSPSQSASHSPEGRGLQMLVLHHTIDSFSFFKYNFGGIYNFMLKTPQIVNVTVLIKSILKC